MPRTIAACDFQIRHVVESVRFNAKQTSQISMWIAMLGANILNKFIIIHNYYDIT